MKTLKREASFSNNLIHFSNTKIKDLMKKTVLFFALLFMGSLGYAQITVTFPAAPCVSCLAISAFDCGNTTFSAGNATEGTLYTGTASSPYLGGNGASYPAGTAVASTGVTGMTATIQAGTLASGAGSITIDITGTPTSTGTAQFLLTFAGQGCVVNLTVDPLITAFCSDLVTGDGSGSALVNAAPSCRTILEVNTSAGDGVYFIDVDGPAGALAPFQGYCDMSTDGGGWLLFSKSKFTATGPSKISKIEMTGDVSLSGSTDPWSGGAISTASTETAEFTSPSNPNYYPIGYNGDALQTATDDLSSTAPTELYAIISRDVIDYYRRADGSGSGGCYGTPTTNATSSVIRQIQAGTSIYIQSPKRFNPIQHKCATTSGFCVGANTSGCATDFITETFAAYTSASHTTSSSILLENWETNCSSGTFVDVATGVNAMRTSPSGWMGGNSTGPVLSSFYSLYDTGALDAGPIGVQADLDNESAVCQISSDCPFTTYWLK